MQWNWDDDDAALNWILDHEECDAGTALLIFWRANAPYHYHHKNREAVLQQAAHQIGDYDFVHKIAERYQAGFYKNQRFCYDPTNDDGSDFVQELGAKRSCEPFPEVMTHASPGERIEKEQLVAVLVRPLSEKELRKVQQHLDKGWKFLHEHDANVQVTDEPIKIVEAISQAMAGHAVAKKTDRITELGWIWDDQLRRAANWQWLCWDAEIQQIPMLFSPSTKFYVGSWYVIAAFSSPYAEKNGIVRLCCMNRY